MINLDNIATEKRNELTKNIDDLTTLELVRVINNEDKKVPYAIEEHLDIVAKVVDKMVLTLNNNGRIIYIGSGTSGRLGVLDAAECPPTYNAAPETIQALIAGGLTALTQSVEDVEDNRASAIADLQMINFTENDMLIGIAASGRTPYVMTALQYAKELKAKTVAIACSMNSAIGQIADDAIEVLVGAEVITGSTRMKAGTAQKLILNMLSTSAMVKLGKVYSNLMVDVQVKNAKLKQRALNILKELTNLTDDEALVLLEKANLQVKPALVMHLAGVSYTEAISRLATAKGFIRDAL